MTPPGSGGLKSCQKLLLNNFVRNVKELLDNLETQEADVTIKMKTKLAELAVNQEITLFEEEDEPDPSLVTPKLI